MKVASLFSGCGGMDLGFIDAGFDVVWANEIDKEAVITYRNNIGNHIIENDIRNVNPLTIPDVNLVIGGFPCQDFSMLSKRKGLETDRGNLYKNFVGVVATKNPKVFVAENVKGLLTTGGGSAFKKIKEEFSECGYNIYADIYNFADYGVAQLRERLLIIGVRKDLDYKWTKPSPIRSPSQYLTSGEALSGVGLVRHNNEHQRISEKTRERLKLIPEGGNYASIPSDSPYYVKGMISHVYRKLNRNKPSTTIIAAGGGGTYGYHFEEPRPLTNRERARLFGYPDDFVFYGDMASVRKQIGNSVPPSGMAVIAKKILEMMEVKL